MPSFIRLSVLGAGLCALLNATLAAPVHVLDKDTLKEFQHTTTAKGNIVANKVYEHDAGEFWFLTLNIKEISATNDDLDITGTLVHVRGPHGEGKGATFQFDFENLNIDALPNRPGEIVTYQRTSRSVKDHRLHEDQFYVELNFDVLDQNFSVVDDIVGYEIKVFGWHDPNNLASPGSMGLSFAALGAVVGATGRRPRRSA